jgi:hypothetical protein
MKRILTAVFFAGILFNGALSNSGFSWAQDSASSPPPAVTAAPPAATAPASAQPEAPAADGNMPSWLEYKPSYTGEENDIANPHRTSDEMTTWAQQAAADVLTFTQDDYSKRMKGFKKYFKEAGWVLYTAYLRDTKILEMVNGGYSIGAIVTEVPVVVHSGATSGAYHWIMRMPITISFFKKDPTSGESKTGPSGKFYLFMDVVRVSEGGGDDGIQITNWRVMDAPKE